MFPFVIAFLSSLIVAMIVVRYEHLHSSYSHDHSGDEHGPQKFHAHPTPRIGSIPILIGLSLGLLVSWLKGWLHETGWLLLLCALPVCVTGLLEDICRRIRPFWRLLASFISASLAYWLLDAGVQRIDIESIDYLLKLWPISFTFTLLAVGGVSHSINIIDGYNGLAGMVTIMILSAILYVSLAVNDWEMIAICVSLIGATIGFLLLNYPRGLIFAGDGGAYLWGFLIAELSVLLVIRHPNVSPWFPALLVIYPVWETLFSIYRRRLVRRASPGLPDALHLHQLIYLRLVKWMVGSREARHIIRRNSMTSPYLWGVAALSIVPAILFWQNTAALMFCIVFFVIAYGWLYRRLVQFNSPKFLMIRKNK